MWKSETSAATVPLKSLYCTDAIIDLLHFESAIYVSFTNRNHLFYHNNLEPPLFKGDSTSVKNKNLLILTFIF